MEIAGLVAGGVVRWGTPVPCTDPGVYVVSTDEDGSSLTSTFDTAPISRSAVEGLLSVRPELTVDGRRPAPADLSSRLAGFWLPDEVVLYVGLAGTSLVDRVNAYYRTPLGARSPHAGGWFLKTLDPEMPRWVHWARSAKPGDSEGAMLKRFCTGVSKSSRQSLADPDRPFPFANLEWPPGVRKRHGISGARAPRASSAAPKVTSTSPVHSNGPEPSGANTKDASVRSSLGERSSSLRTQQVTAADREAGQVRVPTRSKKPFPKGTDTISVRLQGVEVQARWNPRIGPDRERSGTLRLGPQVLAELVPVGTILIIRASADGLIELSLS
jgi:hypothetical protein